MGDLVSAELLLMEEVLAVQGEEGMQAAVQGLAAIKRKLREHQLSRGAPAPWSSAECNTNVE